MLVRFRQIQLTLVRSESHGTEVEISSPSPHSQAAGSREEGGTYDAGYYSATSP